MTKLVGTYVIIGGPGMKWVYFVSFVAGLIATGFWTFVTIYEIATHHSMAVLPSIIFVAGILWGTIAQFRYFTEECKSSTDSK
jgi:hypothetical protein